jgi:hypothetical protein
MSGPDMSKDDARDAGRESLLISLTLLLLSRALALWQRVPHFKRR